MARIFNVLVGKYIIVLYLRTFFGHPFLLGQNGSGSTRLKASKTIWPLDFVVEWAQSNQKAIEANRHEFQFHLFQFRERIFQEEEFYSVHGKRCNTYL